MTADDIIAKLKLAPHPEGGYYRQTWIAEATGDDRPAGTCIYFLLKGNERSHWHRVDAAEIWHYYAGAPLVLSLAASEAGPRQDLTLGPDLSSDQQPQILVPTGHWQAAKSVGDWTLVGCTVSPAFQFSGFELAEAGFDIPRNHIRESP
ncbi:cupin domain-containing protein [Tropicibacter sp. R15_0]|uniref:cupin domain-containing protein n=1 Tax=Tropicibacter sp. R15_0 TaxID=2821101 RepID=UPI001ADA6805|nr:cupin domain-containing protein [Tropicibacter sp. R15_0]MBO9466828.1 cupin domain-containing protein [Tropicibacter sp. R15_0]